MKSVNKEILGFNVPVSGVVETLAEAVQAAGSEERVVDLTNNYVLFHSHFGKLRTAIVKKLVELTGVKQEVDKDGKIVETDQEYVSRLEDEGVQLEQFTDAIAALVASVPVDYTQTVRGTGEGSKIAKKWLAFYDAMVEQNKLETFCAKNKIATEGVSEEELRVIVAAKVKEIVTAAQRNALSAVAG